MLTMNILQFHNQQYQVQTRLSVHEMPKTSAFVAWIQEIKPKSAYAYFYHRSDKEFEFSIITWTCSAWTLGNETFWLKRAVKVVVWDLEILLQAIKITHLPHQLIFF